MLISTKDLLSRINEANNVAVISREGDPSIMVASEVLRHAGFKVEYEKGSFDRESLTILHQKFKKSIRNYDLVLLLGFYSFNKDFFDKVNSYQYIILSDSFNYSSREYTSYLVNKKNLNWEGIKTTSYAQTAYEIVNYLDKRLPNKISINGNKIDLELALMLGDWDDNKECKQTEFQNEMAKVLELNDRIPNLERSLGKYALYDSLPLAVHKDLGFKYKTEWKEKYGILKSRIPKEEFIVENPQKKLEEIISEDKSFEDFVNFPSINGNSQKEYFRKIFHPNKSLKGTIERHIHEYYNNMISVSNIKGGHPITSNEIEVNIYYMPSFNPMGNFDLLLLFPKNSIFIPYEYHNNVTKIGIFTKSQIDLHAGMIAAIGGSMKYNNKHGTGGGEKYKGYGTRPTREFPITYFFVIKDLLQLNSLFSIDHLASYISTIEGKKVGVESKDEGWIYYPPFESSIFRKEVSPSEAEKCDILIKDGKIYK